MGAAKFFAPAHAAPLALAALPSNPVTSLVLRAANPGMPRMNDPVAVACQTTATALPTTSMNGRDGIAIFNLGGGTIYVGNSTVTTATGFPVLQNTGISIALGYNKNVLQPGWTGPGVQLYCIAGANQVSPADTRVMEVLQ